jgi:hypothetical protein
MTDDRAAEREPESTEQGADLSPLHLAAISLHESFLAYTAAGFTEDQALELIAKIVRQSGRG